MAINDVFNEAQDGLSNGGDFILDGTNSDTGAAEIGELGATGSCDVYRESDPNDDGTYEVSVLIDQPANEWHSQKNGLVVSQSRNQRLRINNTSGGPIDVYATGMEVDD